VLDDLVLYKRTGGTCAGPRKQWRGLDGRECVALAMRGDLLRGLSRTSCTEPDCAPRGCYVQSDGRVFFNMDKKGECSAKGECLCAYDTTLASVDDAAGRRLQYVDMQAAGITPDATPSFLWWCSLPVAALLLVGSAYAASKSRSPPTFSLMEMDLV